jgi:hypothetical protein
MGAVLAALAALAEGALQYLGGQAMKSIMGNPDLQNVERLVRSAIQEINAATRAAIEENEIRKLINSMEAVFTNLRDYAELKDRKDQLDNQFLLTDAILKTNEAAAQCVALKIPAVLCFVNSVSLNLLARAAFYKLHATPESKLLVGRMAEESATKATTIVDPFIASLDPSIRLSVPNPQCECQSIDTPDGGYTIGYYCHCWALIDGVPVEIVSNRDVTDADYNAAFEGQRKQLQTFRDNAVTNIQVPVHKAVDAWQSAKTAAVALAWDLSEEREASLKIELKRPLDS